MMIIIAAIIKRDEKRIFHKKIQEISTM